MCLSTSVIAVFYKRTRKLWAHTWNICLTFLRGRLTFSLCISWWISSIFNKPSPFLSASSKVCFTHVQKGQRKVFLRVKTARSLNVTRTLRSPCSAQAAKSACWWQQERAKGKGACAGMGGTGSQNRSFTRWLKGLIQTLQHTLSRLSVKTTVGKHCASPALRRLPCALLTL